jgi:hypothetical protein
MSPKVRTIDGVLSAMGALATPMVEAQDPRRHFLTVSMRLIAAAKDELARAHLGPFDDPMWTERWQVAFADLYLEAVQRWDEDGSAPGPWQIVFEAGVRDPRTSPLRHAVVAMHAHLAYDLPQAILDVVSDRAFGDPSIRAAHERDHEHIDQVLATRLAQEDGLLRSADPSAERTVGDQLRAPFAHASSARLLDDTRRQAWRNAAVLNDARRLGPPALKARLDELVTRTSAWTRELARPGLGATLSRRRVAPVLLDDA